ncbi:MAG TPA: (Fe-S)-binding protein, partial [Kofleriaceae bacterium]|nr:(Fe-S)-binding protein [Kofleriaceae bacterium]
TDGWRSDEVREALDLCLACKACKHECPTGVDLASYKAEFMTHHWEGRLRPRAQYAFGWLPRWLTIMRPLAPLVNWLGKTAPFSSIAKWLAGISPERELPKLARRSFRRSFRAAPADPRAPRVILWPDTFNDAFYPEILHASVRALEQLGFAVDIPRRRLCCARPMIEYGMLEPARRRWRRTLHELGDEIDRGTLVVGVEPSCTTTFRDELLALFPDDDRAKRLSEQTVTIAELIDRYALPVPRATEAGEHALYHRHCHQHAVLSPETEARILRASGLDLEVLDSGCCGMAGAFGFQRETYEHSVALAERVLLPAMRAHPDALVIADGFSCREQVRQLTGIRPLHTAEILAAARPDTRVTRPDASPAQISPPLP